jgi:hypothetical protein
VLVVGGEGGQGGGMKRILLLTVVAGCASPAPVAPAPDPHAGVVESLVGAWAGEADTPIGDLPFAIEFVREADGSVHGRAEQGPGMYLDFHFRADGGRWVLHEAGELPGAGVQRHVLVPAGADGGAARWTTADPSYLAVTIGVDGDAMSFVTTVRGEDHAAFRLRRRAQGVSSR